MITQYMIQRLLKWYFTLPLCTIFTAFSCEFQKQEVVAVKEYSGEDLFKGLFFLEGEVAEIILKLRS